MAYKASIEWTGDQTFKITYNFTSVGYAIALVPVLESSRFQLSTTRYLENNTLSGTIKYENATYSPVISPKSGSSGVGKISYVARDTTSAVFPPQTKKVYVQFFSNSYAADDLKWAFLGEWGNGGAAANAWLESQTWSYIFTRSQPLSTPTGLNADNITSNSATISWNAVENASDYKVEYRRQGDTTWNE